MQCTNIMIRILKSCKILNTPSALRKQTIKHISMSTNKPSYTAPALPISHAYLQSIINILLKLVFYERLNLYHIYQYVSTKKFLQKKTCFLTFLMLYLILFLIGPLVKRLRRGPLKAESWVRFPYGSPKHIFP